MTALRFCPACAGELQPKDFGDQGTHPVCPDCGFVLWRNLKPCVDALIVRSERDEVEVLLGRRVEEPHRGKWDTPGGFLNVGDTAESRLDVCVPTEVGISVRVGDLVAAIPDHFGDIEIITLFYACEPLSGEPQPGGVVDMVEWFPLSDLPQLAFAGVEQAMGVLRERLS